MEPFVVRRDLLGIWAYFGPAITCWHFGKAEKRREDAWHRAFTVDRVMPNDNLAYGTAEAEMKHFKGFENRSRLFQQRLRRIEAKFGVNAR